MSQLAKPFISVVVCAFNEQATIRDCVESLRQQTYAEEKYEVLIIDDESTDRTFEIADESVRNLSGSNTRIRLVRIQHGGLSVARNAGIQLSQGDFIAFIDGDAVAEPSWLEELSKPLAHGADYVGGRIDLLNKDSWVASFLQRTRNRQFFGPHLWNDECIGCNMGFRKRVFHEVDGFHENFVSRGDETTLRDRIRHKFNYAAAPKAVVLHERPATLWSFFRTEWKSATLAHLSMRASGKSLTASRTISMLEQFLATSVFPVLCVLFAYSPNYFFIPLLLCGAAFVRRVFLRRFERTVLRELMKTYGLLRGLAAHVMCCAARNAVSFWGQTAGFLINRNITIVPPMTTPLHVLQSVDSHSEMHAARCG